MLNRAGKFFWLVSLVLLAATSVLAQDDTTINTEALLHDSRDSLYRTPGGAVPLDTLVVIRFRTAANSADAVTLRAYRTFDESQSLVPMAVSATTPGGYDLWEATLDVGAKTTVYYYRFLVTKGDETVYYEDDTRPNGFDFVEANKGGVGTIYEQSPDLSYQISVYDPAFYTPEWMRNAVIYQIFPDRFRNGDPTNDPSDGSDTFYGELPLIYHETWNEPPIDGRQMQAPSGAGYYNSDFFGGDLQGVIDKLDYLQSLGVTAIYLNPIFEARSNHRYDTSDYTKIDSILGDLETFQTLVSEANARGIQIILDGVLNHLSSDSYYFDRYHRFNSDGACESLDSAYRAWFFFAAPRADQPSPCVETPDGATYYVSWAGFDSIPKINSTLIETRRYLFLDEDSVAQQWMREGIGGWRLDVANEIDDGRNPAELYWEAFRNVMRRVNPEAVIVGEFWNDASEWLLGDEWDSTMNYRFRRAIIGFVRDTEFVDNDGRIPALLPSTLDASIRSVEEDYPPMAYHAMMNLLDSHDTTRLLFAVDNNPDLQKLAALTQFTLPGAPTIYYGDEIAIDAPDVPDNGGNLQDDPYNRAPYPWGDTEGDYYPAPDEDMLAFYQQIAALRNATPALREGEMVTLTADDATGVYAFLRTDAANGSAAVVVLNSGTDTQEALLDWSGLLPTGLTLTPLFNGDSLSTDSGSVEISIAGESGNIWTVTADQAAFAMPAAPTNVETSGGNGEVEIAWDAVEGAAGYLVYRSPVATGGFELLDGIPTAETTFADNTITNGYRYFYAVAAVSETNLIGNLSESAEAVPSAPIDAVFYTGDAIQEEQSLELVSGVTVPLAAGIRIAGLTEAEGAAGGIRAQATLLATDVDVTLADWQPMTYSGEFDAADIYSAVLTPMETGEFATIARFSTDAGANWTTVTLDDASIPLLHVTASSDMTAPAAPETLDIARASLSGVFLSWEAVEDENLSGYRIYRLDDAGTVSAIGDVSADAEPGFVDPTVVEGDEYLYGITAVDSSLNESEMTLSDVITVEQQQIPVTFNVTVPEGTEGDVYIAGNFGTGDYPSWDPAGIVMEQVDSAHWTITLELPEGAAIEYKFARGNWERVEKGVECEEIANRRLSVVLGDAEAITADHTVEKWRDVCGV
jgi:glycosidase/fibronectin type 3 domain-containing protein